MVHVLLMLHQQASPHFLPTALQLAKLADSLPSLRPPRLNTPTSSSHLAPHMLLTQHVLQEEVLKITSGQPVKNVFDAQKVNEVHSWVYIEENYNVSVTLFKNFTALLEGVIKPVRVELLPNGLAGIPEGLKRLEANKISGVKLVARPQETP